jgi:glucose-1-phosphate adenylyltransferase
MADAYPGSVPVSEAIENTVAVVLGGGRGTRLYPLTAERAKPAVPLGGRYRLVDIPISNCLHSRINRIFVLTQFNSASLNRHITGAYRFEPFSRGFVEVLAAEQTMESGGWFQGTADAVRQHLKDIMHLDASHFLILGGDQLYRMDYRDFMETHLNSGADITVAVLPVDRRAAHGLGILNADRHGRITQFVEKPQTDEEFAQLATPPEVLAAQGIEAEGHEYLASMGIYLFRPDVLEHLLLEKTDWIDFGRDVIPKSLETLTVHAHLFSGYWEDIGTVQSYYEASIELTQPDPPFHFYDPAFPIHTHARYLPGSRVQDAAVVNSVICEGCRIAAASIADSILGIRTIVQSNAAIERSVVMGADFYDDPARSGPIPIGIGENTLISRAIIDKNARIGRDVVIRGDKGLSDCVGAGYVICDGIVVVLKNAVIADGSRIGRTDASD